MFKFDGFNGSIRFSFFDGSKFVLTIFQFNFLWFDAFLFNCLRDIDGSEGKDLDELIAFLLEC